MPNREYIGDPEGELWLQGSDGIYVNGGTFDQAAGRLLPTAVKAASIGRDGNSGSNLASLSTGRQSFQLLWLAAGTVISNLAFSSWTTAGGSLTNQWFSLYSLSGAKLAVTVDDTTAAWASFAVKSLALSSPYTVPASGYYYAGVMVAATTVPSMAGSIGPDAYNNLPPIGHGVDTTNTGLTNPASAPAQATIIKNTTAGTLLAYVT